MAAIRSLLRWAAGAAAALPLLAAAQVDSKACTLLLLAGKGNPQPLVAMARKVQASCANARSIAPGELAKAVKDARQQGAKRLILVGQGVGANAALAFAGSSGDTDGVVALGGEAAANEFGALPALAAGIKQHVPLLWLVPAGDPLAARGEDYAFAKAPPHPASRFVPFKGDAAEAGARLVLDWLKALD